MGGERGGFRASLCPRSWCAGLAVALQFEGAFGISEVNLYESSGGTFLGFIFRLRTLRQGHQLKILCSGHESKHSQFLISHIISCLRVTKPEGHWWNESHT